MDRNTLGVVCLVALSVNITGKMALSQVAPGSPLPGLTAQQLVNFADGKEDFLEVEEADEGLGPAFNAASCAVCHSLPAIGGGGNVTEIRAGRLTSSGFVEPAGGSLIHLFSIPNHSCQPKFPPGANVIARRAPISVFGDGLVELIPDALIRALEDPTDRDGDGISGRAAIIQDVASGTTRVGRFGWKAQQATLLSFSGDAYLNEMGITNDLFPREVGSGLSPSQLAACDAVTDPEDHPDAGTGLRGIDKFTNFMKFLAPISPAPQTSQTLRGAGVFVNVGCGGCHVPVLVTGPSSDPVFDRKAVPAFSDFLLHDIGTGDGIAQAAASPNEIRTPPLWGLRFRLPLMHDGESTSITDVINRHAGEASRVKQRFTRLSQNDQRDLLAFLGSL